MALSVAQLAQLRTANPFLSDEDFKYADFYITDSTGLVTADIFAKLLEYTTTSLGVLQYLLEEPDEVLLNVYPFKSGTATPAANTITDLETATTSSKVVTGVMVSNLGAATCGISLYHLVGGVASANPESDTIIFIPAGSFPIGTTPVRLRFALRPGDKLRCKSTNATTSFVSYIVV